MSWWYKGEGGRFKKYSSGLREKEGRGYLLQPFTLFSRQAWLLSKTDEEN